MKKRKWLWIVGIATMGAILICLYFVWTTSSTVDALTVKDFNFLHLNITLEEIEAIAGPPEPGGQYMYMYKLSRDRHLELRFSGCTGLQGAWISYPNKKRQDFFTKKVFSKTLTLHDFDFLEFGLPYTEIIENVGEPHIEYGMAEHLARYYLSDGRLILLRLGMPDQEEDDCIVIITGAWLVSGDNEYTPLIELPALDSD